MENEWVSRWMDSLTDGWVNGFMDGLIHGWVNGGMHTYNARKWMYTCMHGWIDRWMNEKLGKGYPAMVHKSVTLANSRVRASIVHRSSKPAWATRQISCFQTKQDLKKKKPLKEGDRLWLDLNNNCHYGHLKWYLKTGDENQCRPLAQGPPKASEITEAPGKKKDLKGQG